MKQNMVVQRSLALASGRDEPLGYVFMIGRRPAGPMRATRDEAMKDAVDAREAWVDLRYRVIFTAPLTWVADIWP